jgi:hypothetical protein
VETSDRWKTSLEQLRFDRDGATFYAPALDLARVEDLNQYVISRGPVRRIGVWNIWREAKS